MKAIDPEAPRGSRNAISSATSAKPASVATVRALKSGAGGAYHHRAAAANAARTQTTRMNVPALINLGRRFRRPTVLLVVQPQPFKPAKLNNNVSRSILRHPNSKKVVVSHASPDCWLR